MKWHISLWLGLTIFLVGCGEAKTITVEHRGILISLEVYQRARDTCIVVFEDGFQANTVETPAKIELGKYSVLIRKDYNCSCQETTYHLLQNEEAEFYALEH